MIGDSIARVGPSVKLTGHKNTPKIEHDSFLCGVWSCVEYLVVTGEPTLAKHICKEHGIKQGWALTQVKRTGAFVRQMNKFIREEL